MARPSPEPPPAPRPAVAHLEVGSEYAGQRLDNFLLRELRGVPKTHIYRIIRSGEVRVGGQRASADARLAEGDVLRIPPLRMGGRTPGGLPGAAPSDANATHAPPREFPLVFEDDHLLVIAKPAGTAVHGGSGVAFGVIEQLRRARPEAKFLELVHRLDRETSGLLMVAKRRSALTALQQQLRERETHKIYEALVLGDWPAGQTVIDTPLIRATTASGERRVHAAEPGDAGAQRSISLVRLLERRGGFSLVSVTLKTGRTHQIRVHLASRGHPIAGDDKYGDFAQNKALAARRAPLVPLQRMFLHAGELGLTHPATGQPLRLHAPMPSDCAAFWASLAPSRPAADPAPPPDAPAP